MASDSCLTAAAAGFAGRGELGSWQLGIPRFSSSCREVLVISRRTGLPRFSSSRQGGAIFLDLKSLLSLRQWDRLWHELRTTIEGTGRYGTYTVTTGYRTVLWIAHIFTKFEGTVTQPTNKKYCPEGTGTHENSITFPKFVPSYGSAAKL